MLLNPFSSVAFIKITSLKVTTFFLLILLLKSNLLRLKGGLIGGLFAEREGRLLDYCRFVFAEFFKRELEIDQIEAVSAVIERLGMSSEAYRDYLNNEGAADYESCLEEAMEDQLFGVPMFIFEGEQFWGHDRIWLIEKRLEQSFKSDVSHA